MVLMFPPPIKLMATIKQHNNIKHNNPLYKYVKYEITTLAVIVTDCNDSCKANHDDHEHDSPAKNRTKHIPCKRDN
jgi:hypothetical protein